MNLSMVLKCAAIVLMAGALPYEARAYDVYEKSIVELQDALAAGEVTSRQIVEGYLARIAAYDQAGPKLNSIVTLNPKALEEAEALDKERGRKKLRGPLHGIPVLVKDNYETLGMPTSAGSLAFATYQSANDSFAVKRLRAAGAIILGKTTMHELANGITNIASYTGLTRNPYDPARSPGGSSGGTGAAVGASLAAAGMGSDTCGSIRIPSAFQNLMGLRGTQGLSSCDGIFPLSSTQDIGGPLARSVTDLAIMLDATVGYDANDPITAESKGRIPKSYRDALTPDGLKGARIGVVRFLYGNTGEDRDYGNVVDAALAKMKEQGAEVIEVTIPGLEELLQDSAVITLEFRKDMDAFLAKRPNALVQSWAEIYDKGLVHEQLLSRRAMYEKRDDEALRRAFTKRKALREVVVAQLAEKKLDALAYPTITRLPNQLTSIAANGGSTCQLSATTGLPAMAVAVGFGAEGTPVGMELLGAPFAEATLLKLSYGWEQFAKPRKAPYSTPSLTGRTAPASQTVQIDLPAQGTPGAQVTFTYDAFTGVLRFDATSKAPQEVLSVTVQRGTGGKAGGVVARLLAPGQQSGAGEIALRVGERRDLAAENLYVHLYTRGAPLGAGRAPIKVPVVLVQD
jgi:Asp-tRNA(Asn)/Glu-tRNA(Gln) amidotransferase A subunit family amidase